METQNEMEKLTQTMTAFQPIPPPRQVSAWNWVKSYSVHSVNITQKLITKCLITPSFINSCSNRHISKKLNLANSISTDIFSSPLKSLCLIKVKLKMITFYFWRHSMYIAIIKSCHLTLFLPNYFLKPDCKWNGASLD